MDKDDSPDDKHPQRPNFPGAIIRTHTYVCFEEAYPFLKSRKSFSEKRVKEVVVMVGCGRFLERLEVTKKERRGNFFRPE